MFDLVYNYGKREVIVSTVLLDPSPAGSAPVNATVALLEQTGELLAEALQGVSFGLLDDALALQVMTALEGVGRMVDGARVRSASDVGERADRDLGHGSLAWRMGCRGKIELITMLTRVSGQEAKRRMRLGGFASERVQLGMAMPAYYPAVAAGLASGELGVDSAEIIVTALTKISRRCPPDALEAAERALVNSATGAIAEETIGLPGEGIAFSADLIRAQAFEWQARLDPDGAAPSEIELEAKSNLGFGLLRHGLYPLRGGVTPELRGILNGIFATHLSARATPAFPTEQEQALIDAGEIVPGAEEFSGDTRTGGEKRADILRGVFESAARDPKTPRMGGAAPTVLVHVNARDLADDCGVGWADGVEAPLSLGTVKQMICAGGYQKIVFGENGEVLHLGDKQRFFSNGQRRAIAARDGGCIIPGCTVPAYWSEVHHVIPWQQHGPTDISNGVNLCWFHHHTIDTSGWEIRMIHGKPEVRAPLFYDLNRHWVPVRKHPASQPTANPLWHT